MARTLNITMAEANNVPKPATIEYLKSLSTCSPSPRCDVDTKMIAKAPAVISSTTPTAKAPFENEPFWVWPPRLNFGKHHLTTPGMPLHNGLMRSVHRPAISDRSEETSKTATAANHSVRIKLGSNFL